MYQIFKDIKHHRIASVYQTFRMPLYCQNIQFLQRFNSLNHSIICLGGHRESGRKVFNSLMMESVNHEVTRTQDASKL